MEIWEKVKDYEGLYEVSSEGRIRSVYRKVWNPGCNCYRTQYSKILKLWTDNKGYKRVSLSKYGKTRGILVHRLVAFAFIPNPDCLPHINHKNEIPSDNRIENLEWCDIKYNNGYGSHGKHVGESHSKPVLQYTLDGSIIREWPNSRVVEREIGIPNTNIISCCLGRTKRYGRTYNCKQAGGFIWKFKENNLKID